jgi:transcriptional regulator with XRE-family HTH domain
MFGELVKTLRSEKRLGLREFCVKAGCDPSNWSKIERGLLIPPQDEDSLKRVALVLGIPEGSKGYEQLVDYAQIGAGRIPEYVLSDEALVKKLPLFFRTVSGKKPTRKDLEKLAKVLKSP